MENNQSPVENISADQNDHIRKRQSNNVPERIIDIRNDHQESSHLLEHVDDPRKCPQMHRVLPQLRLKKHHIEHVYDPVIVSLGPYHHGNSSLQQVEKLKSLCVDWLSLGSKEKEKFFHNEIMQNIGAIRDSYAETSILDKYSDDALAQMMLRDACFVINYMTNMTGMKMNNITDWQGHFGWAAVPFIVGDILKLENQVPFRVVKLLIGLQQGEEWEELLCNFLMWLLLRDGSKKRVRIPREHEDPPLHLLEAVRRAIAENDGEEDEPVKQISQSSRLATKLWQKLRGARNKKNDDVRYHSHSHSQSVIRSVMDLKAKGIYFSPSSSYSLKAVKFKSFSYYGELQLPIRHVSDQHVVILSNLIAYELSPDTKTDYTILSYTILIKSLIETPEDVKELQKRGILFNKYLNHEQVVKSYKAIDTYGFVHTDVFGDVKERIREHCRNRAKTWMADLIHTRLQSPWSIMALFAATFLLCLTALQTFYSIYHHH